MNGFHQWFCHSAFWRAALKRRLMPWALDGSDLGRNVLEIGPGPGLATDVLRRRFARVTTVEIDPLFAEALARRMRHTNVQVTEASGAALPFGDQVFSGAVCFTMLHHVPSPAAQDRLLAEVRRVLRPGGIFAGTDSRGSRGLRLVHYHDTFVPVDPLTFRGRLERAGFREVSVEAQRRAFRFRARRG
jgi:SAM-dependent methyltransferase